MITRAMAIAISLASLCACSSGQHIESDCSFSRFHQPTADSYLYGRGGDKAMRAIPLDEVVISSKGLLNKVMIQDVTSDVSPSGTVEVGARLINCTNQTLAVQLRAHFTDDTGHSAESPTAWFRTFLQPHAVNEYRESSTRKADRIGHFLIEMRKAK